MGEEDFGDVAVVAVRLDPDSAFQRKTTFRITCKKAFAERLRLMIKRKLEKINSLMEEG